MKLSSILSIIFSLSHLAFSFLVTWLTLGWRVRKARKAFEKQLILQGMSKRDAERLSTQYSKLKKELMKSLKTSIFRKPSS